MTYFPNTTYNKSKIAEFDGTSDYLSISAADIQTAASSTNVGGDDASELNPTKDESFSVSAWVYMLSTSAGKGGINKNNLSQAEDGWIFGWSGGFIMQVGMLGTGARNRRTLYTAEEVPEWRHHVWVYDHSIADGAENTFQEASMLNYQNGQDFTKVYASTTAYGEFQVVGADAGSFNIGRSNISSLSGNGYFGGWMSEVSYWNAALTKAQIAELYNGGQPSDLKLHTAASNLKGWWLGGDGTVTFSSNYTAQDSSGGGFHLTSAGMADGAIISGRIGA